MIPLIYMKKNLVFFSFLIDQYLGEGTVFSVTQYILFKFDIISSKDPKTIV
jgi:hypothetical protein